MAEKREAAQLSQYIVHGSVGLIEQLEAGQFSLAWITS
jgi:hypothetical protein